MTRTGKKLCDLGSKCIAIGTSLIEGKQIQDLDTGSWMRPEKRLLRARGLSLSFPVPAGILRFMRAGKYKVLDSRGRKRYSSTRLN